MASTTKTTFSDHDKVASAKSKLEIQQMSGKDTVGHLATIICTSVGAGLFNKRLPTGTFPTSHTSF